MHCFGTAAPGRHAPTPVPAGFEAANPALQTLAVDLEMVRGLGEQDVLHSHTWYANLAGHVGGLLTGVPHVLTAHSLEPSRPWKAEQLGGGYRVSSWAERTAYRDAAAVIAVSDQMRSEVLAAYPFVDAGARARRAQRHRHHCSSGPSPRPSSSRRTASTSTGRTCCSSGGSPVRRASRTCCARLPGSTPACSWCCARRLRTPRRSAPRPPGWSRELQESRGDVVWIQEHASRAALLQLLTHALAFLCPSVYEPLGIVNLEAMACETAVVASRRRRHPRGRRRRARPGCWCRTTRPSRGRSSSRSPTP